MPQGHIGSVSANIVHRVSCLQQQKQQLPRAEQAVAAMYRPSFHMTAREARQRAAINTDLVFRSHDVFPY